MSKYFGAFLPETITKLSDPDGLSYLHKYQECSEIRNVGHVLMPWPKNGSNVFAVQEGFVWSQTSYSRLLEMINTLSPTGVVFWATFDINMGFFKTDDIQGMLDWLDGYFLVTPISICLIEHNTFLFIDDGISFSIIFTSDEDVISEFFGGRSNMKNEFLTAIKKYYPMPDDKEFEWLANHVLKLCTW